MPAHVSAAEAARVCGLSEKTVRRWIRAGRLRADKRDGAYSVALDDVSALAGKVSAPASGPGADTTDEAVRPSEDRGTDSQTEPLLTIIRELQVKVTDLAASAGMWQVRAEVLSHQLEQARGELLALKAGDPQGAHQTPTEANLTAQAPDPTKETSAPWYRRWWAWAVIAL
jgi:hypothetical protein